MASFRVSQGDSASFADIFSDCGSNEQQLEQAAILPSHLLTGADVTHAEVVTDPQLCLDQSVKGHAPAKAKAADAKKPKKAKQRSKTASLNKGRKLADLENPKCLAVPLNKGYAPDISVSNSINGTSLKKGQVSFSDHSGAKVRNVFEDAAFFNKKTAADIDNSEVICDDDMFSLDKGGFESEDSDVSDSVLTDRSLKKGPVSEACVMSARTRGFDLAANPLNKGIDNSLKAVRETVPLNKGNLPSSTEGLVLCESDPDELDLVSVSRGSKVQITDENVDSCVGSFRRENEGTVSERGDLTAKQRYQVRRRARRLAERAALGVQDDLSDCVQLDDMSGSELDRDIQGHAKSQIIAKAVKRAHQSSMGDKSDVYVPKKRVQLQEATFKGTLSNRSVTHEAKNVNVREGDGIISFTPDFADESEQFPYGQPHQGDFGHLLSPIHVTVQNETEEVPQEQFAEEHDGNPQVAALTEMVRSLSQQVGFLSNRNTGSEVVRVADPLDESSDSEPEPAPFGDIIFGVHKLLNLQPYQAEVKKGHSLAGGSIVQEAPVFSSLPPAQLCTEALGKVLDNSVKDKVAQTQKEEFGGPKVLTKSLKVPKVRDRFYKVHNPEWASKAATEDGNVYMLAPELKKGSTDNQIVGTPVSTLKGLERNARTSLNALSYLDHFLGAMNALATNSINTRSLQEAQTFNRLILKLLASSAKAMEDLASKTAFAMSVPLLLRRDAVLAKANKVPTEIREELRAQPFGSHLLFNGAVSGFAEQLRDDSNMSSLRSIAFQGRKLIETNRGSFRGRGFARRPRGEFRGRARGQARGGFADSGFGSFMPTGRGGFRGRGQPQNFQRRGGLSFAGRRGGRPGRY